MSCLNQIKWGFSRTPRGGQSLIKSSELAGWVRPTGASLRRSSRRPGRLGRHRVRITHVWNSCIRISWGEAFDTEIATAWFPTTRVPSDQSPRAQTCDCLLWASYYVLLHLFPEMFYKGEQKEITLAWNLISFFVECIYPVLRWRWTQMTCLCRCFFLCDFYWVPKLYSCISVVPWGICSVGCRLISNSKESLAVQLLKSPASSLADH